MLVDQGAAMFLMQDIPRSEGFCLLIKSLN